MESPRFVGRESAGRAPPVQAEQGALAATGFPARRLSSMCPLPLRVDRHPERQSCRPTDQLRQSSKRGRRATADDEPGSRSNRKRSSCAPEPLVCDGEGLETLQKPAAGAGLEFAGALSRISVPGQHGVELLVLDPRVQLDP